MARLPPAASRGPARCLPAALALLAAAAASACASGKPRVLVRLDEAFAASRPALAAALAGIRPGGRPVDFGLLPLGARQGSVLEELAAASRTGRGPRARLVASPLLASALLDGIPAAGLAWLAVPEWQGPRDPRVFAVASDPAPAWAAAGRAAGAYVAALKAGGAASPACGLLYAESYSRPRRALEAFARAYEAAAGAPPLVREPASREESEAEAGAEAAVKELLGADLRVLLVALGREGSAALRAAARPGLALGSTMAGGEDVPQLSFRIVPDEAGIARSIDSAMAGRDPPAAAGGGNPGKGPGGVQVLVPSRLLPGPAAGLLTAGGRRFDAFVTQAAAARP